MDTTEADEDSGCNGQYIGRTMEAEEDAGIKHLFSLVAKAPDEILLQANIEQALWEPSRVV